MLKTVEIEQLSVQVIREITSPAQGVVLIDCRIAREEEDEEPLTVPLHWRVGDWSKPPIDIALDADTGRFQSLQLVLQDETIERRVQPAIDVATLTSETGIPVFERTLWNNGERYADERLQPTPSWEGQSGLLVMFVPVPALIIRACLVDKSLMFLLDERDEIIGFQLNQITREEKRTIRWAAP
ncbi:MAG TPA: hypothetical protein VFV38_08180 [Ktedonobacteraceae bacterium]|nr:hypothetical protein [Ktedonobacteraceae bacterium]